MPTLRFDVLDVFTDTPFSGNQLAVVHGADELSAEQMRTIAAEFGYAETTFPLPPTQPGADYRVRIFTPAEELPFAGHPSVGTSWLLARDGVIGVGPAVQECLAGLLPVVVDARGSRISGGKRTVGTRLDRAAVAAAVGLTVDDLSDVDPGHAGCGLEFAYLGVKPDAVGRAVADRAAMRAAGVDHGVEVFSLVDGEAHVRMFGYQGEDAATGSAALGLCVFAIDRGLIAETADIVVRQGIEMERPSTLYCSVTPDAATVRGDVVHIASGQLTF
ncbi:PhzF family phenazine biosynthesis protein [Kutzneria sp. 744]|uniref:PhzF family phenazine biosynthesis protein n=1 Tax=Kutzneria sp. (strain 744) TaxID=345341 RepID=UPI0003EEDA36|nr:PhzF family phenazine biosynthesis protein [Kutzneria sp. 744]EWM13934.1 phenazine biosynthesis PhzC/PhzF protein [Kutzneria sp. 744]